MKKYLIIPIICSYPALVLAVNSDLKALLENITSSILTPLIYTLLVTALVVFFWGVVQYIWSEGTGKATGRSIMFWGVIALFVMTSVWGLVNLVKNSFDLRDTPPPIPSL